MKWINPVADEWTEQYALAVLETERIVLTPAVASLLEFALAEHIRPIILTSDTAAVSPAVSLAMRDAGGLWAIRSATGGIYDGLTGFRINAFEDLWLDGSLERDQHPSYHQNARGQGLLAFDAYGHHHATDETVIGPLAEHMITSLGGQAPTRWDHWEPLGRIWNHDRLTEIIRSEMPQSRPLQAGADDGSHVGIQVGRTRRGILEHVRGGVPVGVADDPRVYLDRGGQALRDLQENFRPTIAFVSYRELDDDGFQRPRGRQLEVPLAVYIGPRAVRDLGIDIAELSKTHDIEQLGRSRVASMLIKFSAETPLWMQLVKFAFDLDQERLNEALTSEFQGGPSGN